jgi:hypothetical protein
MKKIITTLICVSAIAAGAWAQSAKKTDVEEGGLKGKVKSVKETYYEAINKFGEVIKGKERYPPTLTRYDVKGNKTEWNGYNSDGSFSYKYTYKYDAKGNTIEKIEYNSAGSLKSTWEYDNKGNNIEYNEYSSGGSLGKKVIYKYDDKGNRIEQNEYNSDGSLREKSTFKYDAKENRIERNEYNSRGSLRYKSTYKYDNKGNEIEWNEYNSAGGFDYKYTYKYDAKGNNIEYKTYILVAGALYEIFSTTLFKYDANDNVIEKIAGDSVHNYNYRYDRKGNWTVKIYFSTAAHLPVHINERAIEYYE